MIDPADEYEKLLIEKEKNRIKMLDTLKRWKS